MQRKKRCSLRSSLGPPLPLCFLLFLPFFLARLSFFLFFFFPTPLVSSFTLSLTRPILLLFLSLLPFQAPIPSALPRNHPNGSSSGSGSSGSGSGAAARRGSVAAAASPVSGPGADPSKRVVVTGLGVVSCLGNEVDEFYNNLLAVRREGGEEEFLFSCLFFSFRISQKEKKNRKNHSTKKKTPSKKKIAQIKNLLGSKSLFDETQGKSGISQISGWDASTYSTQFAGEIKDFDCGEYVSKKNARRMDAVIKYALVAGKKALQDASIDFEKPGEDGNLRLNRCGILVGTAMGGMQTFATAVEDQATKGFRRMNPFCIPFAITNMPGALLAMDLGFMGPNYSISTACATGNYCILQAADHIRRGDADLMLAGGADAAVIPSGIGTSFFLVKNFKSYFFFVFSPLLPSRRLFSLFGEKKNQKTDPK